MFKATFSLVYVLALVAIQAYPIAEDYQAEEYEAYAKRDGCGLFGCGGPGIHFTASNLFPSSQFIAPGFQHTTTFPDLTFSTGGGFNIPGMMPCNAMSGQSCGGAPQAMPPQAMPPQAMPPQAMPAPPPLAPQGCDQKELLAKEQDRMGTGDPEERQWRQSCAELACVQDADRLDAIGAFGILRCAAFSGARNRTLHAPGDSIVEDITYDQYVRQSDGTTGTAIAHFHEKLLKLASMMKTECGRLEALQRHDYMSGFLRQIDDEYAFGM
ncbi:hypothetical protein GGI04_004076 [Coemansia thaxteri]|nr:hypothetical protein GGI04_004076 [Coemansia thaxteri]